MQENKETIEKIEQKRNQLIIDEDKRLTKLLGELFLSAYSGSTGVATALDKGAGAFVSGLADYQTVVQTTGEGVIFVLRAPLRIAKLIAQLSDNAEDVAGYAVDSISKKLLQPANEQKYAAAMRALSYPAKFVAQIPFFGLDVVLFSFMKATLLCALAGGDRFKDLPYELQQLIRRWCDELKIEVPTILANPHLPFASLGTSKSSIILMPTHGLLLSKNAVKFILSHELAHIHKGDTRIAALFSRLALPSVMLRPCEYVADEIAAKLIQCNEPALALAEGITQHFLHETEWDSLFRQNHLERATSQKTTIGETWNTTLHGSDNARVRHLLNRLSAEDATQETKAKFAAIATMGGDEIPSKL